MKYKDILNTIFKNFEQDYRKLIEHVFEVLYNKTDRKCIDEYYPEVTYMPGSFPMQPEYTKESVTDNSLECVLKDIYKKYGLQIEYDDSCDIWDIIYKIVEELENTKKEEEALKKSMTFEELKTLYKENGNGVKVDEYGKKYIGVIIVNGDNSSQRGQFKNVFGRYIVTGFENEDPAKYLYKIL